MMLRSRRLSVALTVGLSVLVLGGCVFVARPGSTAGGYAPPPATADPPGPQGGPPLVRTHPVEPEPPSPSTPIRLGAHKYRYYPAARVYYAPDRDRYYWLSTRGWRVGSRLPRSISIKGEKSVIVKLDCDVPYLRHAQVEAAYPGLGHAERVSQVESRP